MQEILASKIQCRNRNVNIQYFSCETVIKDKSNLAHVYISMIFDELLKEVLKHTILIVQNHVQLSLNST